MGSDDDEREELVIRARGLPWSATAKMVADFFSGLTIKVYFISYHYVPALSMCWKRNLKQFVSFNT